MNTKPSYQVLAAHILSAAFSAQVAGDGIELEALADTLDVRRVDVRAALTALHQEGLVDAARMRLTLSGFALGQALQGRRLRPLRAWSVGRIGASLGTVAA